MRKLDYPWRPLILGLVLGDSMERALRQSLMMSQGDITILLTRPISGILLFFAAVILCSPRRPAECVPGGSKLLARGLNVIGAAKRFVAKISREVSKMKYRAILSPITALAILVLSFNSVGSQEFKPSKQIEAVVHTGPGGGSDLLARAIAEMLQKEKLISQRMQVVNKPGGGPAVAMSYLADKKGDTHTIGFFTARVGDKPADHR